MGALSKLKALFARPEPLLAPMDDPFIQVDKNATSERLKLKERGAEQGAINQPPEGFSALDAVESEVVAQVVEVYARAQNDANSGVRSYDSRLAELHLLSGVSQIGVSAMTAVSDFKASVVNALNQLSNSRDAIVDSYRELREFKQEHRLQRPAHRASSGSAGAGYIGLAWAAETALNSVLLRQNDELGLLGGIFSAAAIGFLNVGLSAVVGRNVWPLTHHRSSGLRSLGWVLTAAWFAVIGAWNWGAAHYRDAKVSGLEAPEIAALSLLGGPLDSLYSWALLLAGTLFAVLAALAAFRMDDPYPGYGRVWRRHEDRCEAYAEDVALATADAKAIRDEAIDEALSIRHELDRQQSERGQILSARTAFVQRFNEFGAQLEVIANALLQDYRTANLAARSASPPPGFLVRWSLQRTVLPPPPDINVKEDDVRAAEAALERAATEISAAFDQAITQFEPLDQLKRRLDDA